MFRWFTVLTAFLVAIAPALASENGKSGRTSITSAGCGSCHSSTANAGVGLSVKGLTSPLKVTPGQTIDLSIVVAHASAPVAGIDIAVMTDMSGTTSVGTLTPKTGSGLKKSGVELVHSAPKTMSGGQAQFDLSWTAPTTPGTYYLRSIALAANGNGADDNADVWNRLSEFQLVVEAQTPTTSLALTSPRGGETYTTGATASIAWTHTGVSNVNIEWSSTGTNGPWTSVAANVAATSSPYTWTVPTTTTTAGHIRITDVADATRTSVNATAFKIVTTPPPPPKGLIAVLNPAGGEKYHPADTVKIIWAPATNGRAPQTGRRMQKNEAVQSDEDSDDEDGDDDDSDDNSDEDGDDEDGDDNSDEDGDDEDGDDNSDEDGDDEDGDDEDGDDDDSDDSDDSDDDDSDDDDSDTTSAVAMVNIAFSSTGADGPWTTIADSIAYGDFEYRWIVPNVPTETAFIRVQRMDSVSIFGINATAFAIVVDDSSSNGGSDSSIVGMDITHPKNGEVLQPRNVYEITWVTNRAKNVTIQWNRCGEGWEDIAVNIPSSKGRHLWVIPTHADGYSLIRIVDSRERSRIYQFSGVFFLKNPVTTDVANETSATDNTLAPNPVVAGNVVNIHTSWTAPYHVAFYTMMGEQIIDHGLVDGGDAAVNIPAHLSTGTYMMVMTNPTTQQTVHRSITITR